jgi:outer membrane protein
MRAFVMGTAAMAATAFANPAYAAPGDILVKVRGGYALHSGGKRVAVDIDGSTMTAKAKGAVGGEAGLTFFMTDHIAAELALGGASYDLKDATGHALISAGLVTPTAMLQYHLLPNSRIFRPYVGVGVSYANFYSEKPGELLTDRTNPFPTSYSVNIKGALAPVAQVGADIAINDQFYINVDAKYLRSNSKLTIDEEGNRQTVSHKMRSLILGAGVGFRF